MRPSSASPSTANGWERTPDAGLAIARVETIRMNVTERGGWLFVRLHTRDGRIGLGEASQTGEDDVVEMLLLERFAPRVLGEDPRDAGILWQRLVGDQRGCRVMPLPTAAAISALDQALIDLRAQAYGMPVHELLGGKLRSGVRVYANVNRGLRNRSPAGYASAGRAAVAHGFDAVKCAPFDEISPQRLDRAGIFRDLDRAIARVGALRDAVGPDVDVMVDCHGRLTPALAIQAGRELASFRLLWLEEPVCWTTSSRGLAEVAAALDVPLAAGELAFGVQSFGGLIHDGAVDILMPDVKYCGGLREATRIAAAADAGGLMIAPHNPSGPVSTLASVHVAACLSNFLILEFAYDEVAWRADLIPGAEHLVGGELLVPDAAGLGATLNPDLLSQHGVGTKSVAVA